MSTMIFGRTQIAVQTPFEPNRNPQWNGNVGPSLITSVETQSAIEEVRAAAFANDRYTIIASYGGNANTGRYLEIFPSIDSLVGPLIFNTSTKLVGFSLGSTAASTGTVSVYLTTDLVTPVYSASLVAATRFNSGVISFGPWAASQEIALKVSAGSINKPFVCMWLQSTG